MSADLLREAAALMRERAEDAACAIGDQWRMGDRPTLYTLEYQGNDDVWRNAFECGPCSAWNDEPGPKHDYVGGAEEPAAHIASWHPTVALAVADWLDKEADGWDLIDATSRVAIEIGGKATVQHSTHAEAIAVARAYLGRDS